LIEAVRHKLIVPVANVALFCEWQDVLKRPDHLAAAGYSEAEMDEALDELAGLIAPAERKFLWRPQLPDPDDEMVLEAALSGYSSVIVTFEVGTFRAPARRFGIEVLTPGTLWARIKP